jgi:hypothetical protein
LNSRATCEAQAKSATTEEELKAINAGWKKPLTDGFATDELEYLAFETVMHPKVDAKVNRQCACGLAWGHTGKHARKI